MWCAAEDPSARLGSSSSSVVFTFFTMCNLYPFFTSRNAWKYDFRLWRLFFFNIVTALLCQHRMARSTGCQMPRWQLRQGEVLLFKKVSHKAGQLIVNVSVCCQELSSHPLSTTPQQRLLGSTQTAHPYTKTSPTSFHFLCSISQIPSHDSVACGPAPILQASLYSPQTVLPRNHSWNCTLCWQGIRPACCQFQAFSPFGVFNSLFSGTIQD